MYKVFVNNITDTGKCSTGILVEEFTSLLSAKREGRAHLISDKSYYYVKEYSDGLSHIIGGQQDTGMVVYSSRKECEDCPSSADGCVGDQLQCSFYKDYVKGLQSAFQSISS